MQNYYVMLIIFFFMDVGATFVVIFREALFLSTYPPSWLPYYYLAEMLLSLALVLFLHPLALRGYKYFNHSVIGVWVLLGVVGAPFLTADIPLFPFFYALHLFTIYPIVGVSLYNLASSIFTMKDYKKYTCYFMAAGSLGIVTGSLAAEPISIYFTSTAMLASGLLLLSSIWLGMFFLNLPLPIKMSSSSTVSFQHTNNWKTIIFRYPLVLCIFGIAIFMELTNTYVHFSFSSYLSMHYNRDEISILLARVISITYVISFILEAFFMNKLTERYGFNVLFISPPVIIIIGVVISTLFPTFMPLAFYYGAVSSLNNCFNLIGVELALNALPPRVRMWTKLTEGGFIASIGVLLASLSLMGIQLVSTNFERQLLFIALITLIVCLPLFYCGFKIKKYYQETLASHIGLQRVSDWSTQDFFSQEEHLSEHVLHLKINPLASLLSNESSEEATIPMLIPLVTGRDYAKARAALQAICSISGDKAEEAILQLAHHPSLLIRTWTAHAALTSLGEVPRSNKYFNAVRRLFFEEASKRKLFFRVLQTDLPLPIQKELKLYFNFASLRCLCWLMIYLNYDYGKHLIALFLFHPSAHTDLFRRSNILELLQSFADDRNIKAVIAQWDSEKIEPSGKEDLELCAQESTYLKMMLDYTRRQKEEPMDDLLEKLMILRRVEDFKDLTSDVLYGLANEIQWKEMEKGQIIFNQGDEPDGIYIIVSGVVQFHGQNTLIMTRKANELFGNVGVISAKPRITTAIVQEKGMLLFIDSATFSDLIAFFPDFQRVMLYNVVEYLQRIVEHSNNQSSITD